MRCNIEINKCPKARWLSGLPVCPDTGNICNGKRTQVQSNDDNRANSEPETEDLITSTVTKNVFELPDDNLMFSKYPNPFTRGRYS